MQKYYAPRLIEQSVFANEAPIVKSLSGANSYPMVNLASEVDAEIAKLREALSFYADPETYFAIGFIPDRPCGKFLEDFSETDLGLKPGKLARETLGL